MAELHESARIARVIVGVRDEVGAVALLHRAAAEARLRHAVLVPVMLWSPAAYLVLDELVTDTFGPEEPVRVHPLVVRAASLPAAVASVATDPADVVFDGPEHPSLRDRLHLHPHRPAMAG
ncbi:hypothetical protein DN069_22130 [Streptacidiphilus pinicola]|uniref:Universal stress protein n=1 Tax=Streptacidiphilus pinicola TaxID=2219663 RepID=A0A2X0J7I3_9ACTN|nr:hypothetical protein [Streptacidiphilus pinicola]RAG83418.1 hypothetical protein DN069_22130 [Streptacidiphilus pinicola]